MLLLLPPISSHILPSLLAISYRPDLIQASKNWVPSPVTSRPVVEGWQPIGEAIINHNSYSNLSPPLASNLMLLTTLRIVLGPLTCARIGIMSLPLLRIDCLVRVNWCGVLDSSCSLPH